MVRAHETAGLSGAHLLAAAVALSPAERTRIVEEFFVGHPGAGAGRYGLGRAILDFQAWEVASGRIASGDGSAWWRGVNGLMVLDIAAALDSLRLSEPSVQAWRAFASDPEASQAALWEAHQRSLHAGLRICEGLFERECAAERRFAAIVIDIVDRTALANSATDTDELTRLTDRYYPKEYPVDEAALPGLERFQQRSAESLRLPDGGPITNVGLASTRWS